VDNKLYHMAQKFLIGFVIAAPMMAQAEQLSIAAIVNDDVITTNDVSERRDFMMVTSGIPVTLENQQRITPRIVQQLIDETLQLQEAKRQSLVVSEDELAKAMDDISLKRDLDQVGGIKKLIAEKGLSQRTLDNQLRAQLAWQKVVQRKLRRNVSIAQDEITRAQQAQAAAPGTTELYIAVLSLPIEDEKKTTKLADEISTHLKTGGDLTSIAASYMGRKEIKFSQPLWLAEDSLKPSLQQALRDLKPGEVTPALRSTEAIQFVQLLDRQVNKPQDDNTEIAIKQISIDLPGQRDKASVAKLRAAGEFLRKNPGECTSETLPPTDIPATASFARTKMGSLSSQQRNILGRLKVGEVSVPMPGREVVHLIMLCEKIEPAAGNLPDPEVVRQRLFAEKIELEAQKHLRNLRRDAYIDIKGVLSAGSDDRGQK
jgi:peptidyl-prolyl cis-trans isomerase SurA